MNNIKKTSKVIFVLTIFLLSTVSTINVTSTKNTNNEQSYNDLIFNIKIKSLMLLANHGAISAAIIKDDKIIWSKSFGYSHLYLRKKATNQTIYAIGSITKTITATAMLQLYEKGLINLSDDINKYLPFEIRNPNYPCVPITIKSLLTHRSSNRDYYIMNGEGRDELFRLFPFKESTLYWLEELLIPGGKFYKEECWYDFPPDTKTAYSTQTFLIATVILEKVTNQTLEEYCQENIFGPLEMKDTSYHPYALDKKRMARAYLGTKLYKLPLMHYDAGYLAGGGGVRTTLEDISHYVIANMNNGKYKDITILNESTMEMMHDCINLDELYTKYHPYTHGYAWYETDEYDEKMMGHGGGAVGFDCMLLMNKTSKLGIALLTTKINCKAFYNLNYALAHDSRVEIINLILEKAHQIT